MSFLVDRALALRAWLGSPGGLAVIALFVAIVVEAAVGARRGLYAARDTLANLGMWLGNLLVLALWLPWVFFLFDAVHEHAVFDLSADGPLAARAPWAPWLLLFVLDDLAFYAFHRTSHRCRLLWVSHENHHSSERFNLSVALRQTWTPFSAVVFWLPLPLLGFPAAHVMAMQALSLAYQAFTHTQLVRSLGPLEWIFNTPAHHGVHHAADEPYLDKNFGGVLIVWDRLFGTFARARGPLRYGIGEARGWSPVRVAFTAWRGLAADVVTAPSVIAALGYVLRPPGWRPRPTTQGDPS